MAEKQPIPHCSNKNSLYIYPDINGITMKAAIHVYQRSNDWGVIFYTLQDYLVYFTLFSVFARRCAITVLALAIMFNHLHYLVSAEKRKEIERFVSIVTARFARLYNEDIGLTGHVFHKEFGSAVKYGDKNIRTIAGYIYNNHTNKKLCNKAEDIRWNFLAYSHCTHPFSEPIIKTQTRKELKKALAIVDYYRRKNDYLKYSSLRRIYSGLNKKEKEQITDYIISSYNCIDYSKLEGLYRSYDEMVYSFNANTFSEFDIEENKEEREGDDRVYIELARQILSYGKYHSVKEVLKLSYDDKIRLAVDLQAKTGVSLKSIGSYLHIEFRLTR